LLFLLLREVHRGHLRLDSLLAHLVETCLCIILLFFPDGVVEVL